MNKQRAKTVVVEKQVRLVTDAHFPGLVIINENFAAHIKWTLTKQTTDGEESCSFSISVRQNKKKLPFLVSLTIYLKIFGQHLLKHKI